MSKAPHNYLPVATLLTLLVAVCAAASCSGPSHSFGTGCADACNGGAAGAPDLAAGQAGATGGLDVAGGQANASGSPPGGSGGADASEGGSVTLGGGGGDRACADATGECAPIVAACAGKAPGHRFCAAGDVLTECGADSRSTSTVSKCSGMCAVTGATAACVNVSKQLQLAGRAGATCLVSNGSVKCWGTDAALIGSTNPNMGDAPGEMPTLTPVDLGVGILAQAASLGAQHDCALLTTFQVKCWGMNEKGQLGQGDAMPRTNVLADMGDKLAPIDLGQGRRARMISAGARHTCAILDDASVKCWGDNSKGQLGYPIDAKNPSLGDAAGEMGDALPPVDLGAGHTAKSISAGELHTCVIRDDDKVVCWGTEEGVAGATVDSPMDFGPGRTAIALAAGYNSSCALLDNKSVKCWGVNGGGQLGVGDPAPRGNGDLAAEAPVSLGTGRVATALVADAGTTCAILDNGTLKCWGIATFGRLGQGDNMIRGDQANEMGDNLKPIDLGSSTQVTQVALGDYQTCALTNGNFIKCWGQAASLGLGLSGSDVIGDGPGEMGTNLPQLDIGF